MSDQPSLSRRRAALSIATLAAGSVVPAAAAPATPSQTAGPFYPVSNQFDRDADLTHVVGSDAPAQGEVILVTGRVVDLGGRPIPGATVDIWQANHWGRYDHPGDNNPAPLDPGFQGWAIAQTDSAGTYRFKTIKPGAYGTGFAQRCRHIHFKISAPGHGELTTQMYFADDPLLEQDGLYGSLSRRERQLVLAKAIPDRMTGLPNHIFPIVLT